jgi:hypothetical protein
MLLFYILIHTICYISYILTKAKKQHKKENRRNCSEFKSSYLEQKMSLRGGIKT